MVDIKVRETCCWNSQELIQLHRIQSKYLLFWEYTSVKCKWAHVQMGWCQTDIKESTRLILYVYRIIAFCSVELQVHYFGISTPRIWAKGVRWKLTRLRERGGSLLCCGCQGWPLGVSQLWRRSLYHINGASKEPLQRHFGLVWKNRACFDWSATFYCHFSANQQLAPASAFLWLFERRSYSTQCPT